ncbi:MAG: hypothetical protein A2Z27_03530 [candidate division Zixibacteria bacterium RBG_16_50_21]|nr:MAG: hypothetical protein A2Z27_03530 [candidate division Zixibacteria bacterium RBG_16_50_21]
MSNNAIIFITLCAVLSGGSFLLDRAKTVAGFKMLSERSQLSDDVLATTDNDKEEALKFLKKSIYDRIAHAQQGRLRSHLDAASPVEGFIQHNK